MIQAGHIIHFTVIVKTPVRVTKTTISSINHIIFFSFFSFFNLFSNSQRTLTANFQGNNNGLILSRFPNPNGIYRSNFTSAINFFFFQKINKFNLHANLVNEFSIKFSVF